MSRVLPRLAAIAGAAALGPLTGPLLLGLAGCLRAGRRLMAAAYAVALVEVWLGLPALLARELAWLWRHTHAF